MSTWWDVRGGWAAWFQLGNGVAANGATVTALARYPFHLDLFTVGTDNRVYSIWWDERTGWSGWFPLPGITARPDSTVTAVARYPDHLDLFTTASDGRIMSTWWDARGGWASGWFQISGGSRPRGPRSRPSSGTPTTWTCSSSGPTTASTAPGGTTRPAGRRGSTSPAGRRSRAARSPPSTRVTEHLDVFAVGPDGLVRSAWWDASGGWSGWFALGIT